MDEANRLFCEDVVRALDHWVEAASDAVTSPDRTVSPWLGAQGAVDILRGIEMTPEQKRAFRDLLLRAMVGLLDSVMMTLDNAAPLADYYTVEITTSRGEVLGPALNELLMEYLFETGRMTSVSRGIALPPTSTDSG